MGDRIRQWEGKGTQMAGNISDSIVFQATRELNQIVEVYAIVRNNKDLCV